MSRNILDIYDNYKIMKLNLQPHMLRVAAVANIICDACNESGKTVDTKSVVTACLLHDMGNIIKFDLNYFPEFLEPEGLAYWQKIKDEFIQKYGSNEHVATIEIAKELNILKKILDIIESIGFGKSIKNSLENIPLEFKIPQYCDQRVGPYGVLTLSERIEDGRKRYKDKKEKSINGPEFENLVKALEKIEEQIFKNLNISPENINDKNIEKIIEELKNWEI